MSLDEKDAIVIAASTAIAKQRRALVSRGLGDLSKLARPRARILLVNEQRALLEQMEQVLVTGGYEVCSVQRHSDAIDMANAFFDSRDVAIHADEYWSVTPCLAKVFVPRFVMMGFDVPVTLGAELFTLRRRISKMIHWGGAQDWEDLERRREHYEFELLPKPIDTVEVLGQMTSWIAEAWTENGCSLDAQQRHSDALECHEEALEVDPLCVWALINKGYSLDELGRWHEAIECYDKAIKLNTESCASSATHSDVALRWNSFVREGKADDRQWTPWVRKGYVLLDRMGRHKEAVDCFDTALTLSSGLISPREGKGRALDHLRRYQEAIACYDEILQLKLPTWTEVGKAGQYSWAWNLKGATFSHAGRLRDAIECYNRAISLDPKSNLAWYNKGIAEMKMSRLGEAIDCYDRALELWSGHAQSWHNKGCCLRDLGRMAEAISCHEKALACDPPEVLAWHSKAQALEDLGRLDDAVSSYERYLSVAPVDVQHTNSRTHAQARVRVLKAKIGEHS